MNEVILGTLAGIFMGPSGANLFDPRSYGMNTNTLTLEITRVVLAIGLFAIGVELPRSYMAKHARGLAAMVVPTMTIGWVVVAGRIALVFLVISLSYFTKSSFTAYFLVWPSFLVWRLLLA